VTDGTRLRPGPPGRPVVPGPGGPDPSSRTVRPLSRPSGSAVRPSGSGRCPGPVALVVVTDVTYDIGHISGPTGDIGPIVTTGPGPSGTERTAMQTSTITDGVPSIGIPGVPAGTPIADPSTRAGQRFYLTRCRDLAKAAVRSNADPAITADDIASELVLRLMADDEIPTLTLAKRLFADAVRTADKRSVREMASTGYGKRSGRVRRVKRSIALIHAGQIARQIVDRGPSMTVPATGPGRDLFDAVNGSRDADPDGSVCPVPTGRTVTHTDNQDRTSSVSIPDGPWLILPAVRDLVRHLSVQPGQWSMSGRFIGPVERPGPVVNGPAVRYSTVVQAILADGPMSRPDPAVRVKGAVKKYTHKRAMETTVAMPRYPDRTRTAITDETIAKHQIKHHADKGPVRLIREPALTRMLDKRNCYAPTIGNDTAAAIGRAERPSVDGITYRIMVETFLAYRLVGGRGPAGQLATALDTAGTTVGRVISGHVHMDGTATVPAVRIVAALRDLDLPTTTVFQRAMSAGIESAVLAARDAAERTVVPDGPAAVPSGRPDLSRPGPVVRVPVDPAALSVVGIPAVSIPDPDVRWSVRYRIGRDRGRFDVSSSLRPADDGTAWTAVHRYRGAVPVLPAGTAYVPYTGWVV
jgi:hypothetical protein